VSGIDDYIARIDTGQSPAVEVFRLSRDARLGDAIFTGLRLNEGLDVRAVDARYGDDIWARFGQRLQPYCEGGLLEVSPERWRLTRHGMLLAHEVMAVFV
jgi:oxygen-independent coproporphyrinogen-3 oxidase